jgi:hypothetical protein
MNVVTWARPRAPLRLRPDVTTAPRADVAATAQLPGDFGGDQPEEADEQSP